MLKNIFSHSFTFELTTLDFFMVEFLLAKKFIVFKYLKHKYIHIFGQLKKIADIFTCLKTQKYIKNILKFLLSMRVRDHTHKI